MDYSVCDLVVLKDLVLTSTKNSSLISVIPFALCWPQQAYRAKLLRWSPEELSLGSYRIVWRKSIFFYESRIQYMDIKDIEPNILYQPPQFGILAGGVAPNSRGYI